ncbi:MAG TPA: RNA-binding S4 domain-containing protein [Clostridia bacterium]|nr:RNA-binding S4 domain-containing protein [Clostridia bacterium]
MRLDKWLKVSRIIKRRTVAKEVCDAGKAFVNGRPAKAGTEVEVGDEVTLMFGTRTLRVRVLATPETVSADQAHTLYQEL